MNARRLPLAVLALALALPAAAQKLKGALPGLGVTDSKPAAARLSKPMKAAASEPRANLRVRVEAEYAGMRHKADFIVTDAAQSNYVEGGDTAFAVEGPQGKGVEYKKWGFIVNTLPAVDPNDPAKVDIQLQVELSGPVKGEAGVDVVTWQLQTETTLVKDERKELSRGDGKLALTVSDAD